MNRLIGGPELAFCALAVVIGSTLGALRAAYLLAQAEDVDVEPRHLTLIEGLLGNAS